MEVIYSDEFRIFSRMSLGRNSDEFASLWNIVAGGKTMIQRITESTRNNNLVKEVEIRSDLPDTLVEIADNEIKGALNLDLLLDRTRTTGLYEYIVDAILYMRDAAPYYYYKIAGIIDTIMSGIDKIANFMEDASNLFGLVSYFNDALSAILNQISKGASLLLQKLAKKLTYVVTTLTAILKVFGQIFASATGALTVLSIVSKVWNELNSKLKLHGKNFVVGQTVITATQSIPLVISPTGLHYCEGLIKKTGEMKELNEVKMDESANTVLDWLPDPLGLMGAPSWGFKFENFSLDATMDEMSNILNKITRIF